jgi:hypothetical protein
VENISPKFFGIKTACYLMFIFQRDKQSTQNNTIIAGATEGNFEAEMTREFHKCGLVLARKWPGSPGTCTLEETDLPVFSIY